MLKFDVKRKSVASASAPVITGACVRAFKKYKNISAVENIIYRSVIAIEGNYQDCGRGIFSFEKMAKCMREENFYESQVDNKNIL